MDFTVFDRAAAALPKVAFEEAIDLALVLGSGWGAALTMDEVLATIPYAEIPGYGAASIQGHSGTLTIYRRHGLRLAAFMGRRHWYEGVGAEATVMPAELARRLGAKRLLLTNAAGGLGPNLKPGDLMILSDHINLSGMNPLLGPHHPEWGARFPDQSAVYSPELRAVLQKAGASVGVEMKSGVYLFTSGPSYETPAEVRAYGVLGANAVGMSTVPEAMVAHAAGLQVVAMSCITNLCAGLGGALNHAEVMEESQRSTPRMAGVIDAFIQCLVK